MMNFEEYAGKFALAAIYNGHDEAYIKRCLDYARPLAEKGLPIIYNTSHLSKLVGYKAEYLRSVAQFDKAYYWEYKIKKPNGAFRPIREPLPNLKDIQIWILEHILYKIKVSGYAKAYVPGKRLKENVRFHKNRPMVLTLDLTDFFGSIKKEAVSVLFQEMGYTKPLSDLMSLLCCLEGKLPQGAPTSPYISNIFMRDVDDKISRYCKEHQIFYTRYADDMAFSGDFNVGEVVGLVKNLISPKGLTLNDAKTKLMRRNQRQIVTGIVVNEKIQLPKDKRRQIRCQMHYINTFGLENHLKKIGCERRNYVRHLLGEVTYALSFTPNNEELKAYQAKLKELLKA
jgi:RNA-directed DNA polymerase